jgi:xyloglucan-specific exo-beta-1,4-glucanase
MFMDSKMKMALPRILAVSLWFAIGAVPALRASTFGTVTMGGGGYVDGIIACPTQTNLFYCKTDVGGAYRWDETNQSWIPLLDWCSESQTSYQGVESLAIDPQSPNKLYLLSGTSYWNGGATAILRSSDYGATFAITDVTAKFKANGNGADRQKGEGLAVDPNQGNILFCGTRANGLFKSTDAGVTWNAVASFNANLNLATDSISFVQFDNATGTPGNPTQRIFVGVDRTGANFYVSNDAGATWTSLAGSPSGSLPERCALAGNSTLYITYGIDPNGAIMKYNTTNGVWSNVTPARGTLTYCGISVCATNPQNIVASTYGEYKYQPWGPYGDLILVSTNGGTNWVDVFGSGKATQNPNGFPWISGGSIHWGGGLAMDPFNFNRVFVGSGNGIFCTTNLNAGLTSSAWKFMVKGLEETVPINFISVPGGPFITSIGDYGGFIHTDITFSPATGNMSQSASFAYAANKPSFIARILSGGGASYSTQLPVAWKSFASLPPGMTNGYVAVAADGGAVLWNSASSYVTTNLGTNWTASAGLTFSCQPEGDSVNPAKFYAYNSSDGFLYVSADGGLNFSKSGSAGSGGSPTFCTAPGFEGHIWIALNNGGLKYSTNSGATFYSGNVSVCNALAFGLAAPGATYPTLFIWGKPTGSSISGMYRSTDQGATWVRVNDDAHEYGGRGNAGIIEGDKNVYGRVYMSTVGRGVPYLDSAIQLPTAPTGLAAGLTPPSSVTLNWNATPDAATYNIKAGTNSSGPFTLVASNIVTTSYLTTFSSMTNYYVVSAVNGNGVESPDSVPVSVTVYSATLVNTSFETNTAGVVINAKTQSSQGFDVTSNDLAGWLNAGTTYVNSGVDYNGHNSLVSHSGTMFVYSDTGDSGAYQVVGGRPLQSGDQLTLTWWAKSSYSTPSQAVQLLSSASQVNPYSALTLLTNYTSTFASGTSGGPYTQFSLSYTAQAGDAGKFPAVAFMATGTINSFANFDDFNLVLLSIPATPLGLTPSAGDRQVVLNWNSVPNAAGYNVKQSQILGGGGPYTVIATNLTALSYTNSGLVNGNTYYYVVSATNAAGESPDSASVSVVPLPPAPPVISQVSLSGGNLIISGTNGVAGMDYWVLTTTNLLLSSPNWTVLETNTFGPGSSFIFTNPVNPGSPQQFYQLKLP